MQRNIKNSLLIFILVSLFLHLGAWEGLSLSRTPSFLLKKDNVEITILDQSQSEKLLQIVEQQEQLNDETPEDAKFMSAHNQRVVKETRAKDSGDFRNTSGQGENQQPSKQDLSAQQKPTQDKKISRGSLPTLSDLRPKFNPATNRDVHVDNGTGGPSSQTNDYLKDTETSLQTLLNTREFVYYTYYQRIRSQIRQYWEPSIRAKVKKIFAQGRTIASERDHITRLVILLDKNGVLLGVQVLGESGVKDLDDAAVEAFRAAEPFPNPPKGIVEKDGTIKINWDFILEANADDNFKTQRYARTD